MHFRNQIICIEILGKSMQEQVVACLLALAVPGLHLQSSPLVESLLACGRRIYRRKVNKRKSNMAQEKRHTAHIEGNLTRHITLTATNTSRMALKY